MPIDPHLIGDLLQPFGFAAPFVIVLLRAAAALLAFVPSSPVVLAAGASQGPLFGTLLVMGGAELGALAAFGIGRVCGRSFVTRRGWTDRLSRTRPGAWLLDGKASQRRLMLAVFYCRLLPGLNLDGLSYVAGLTPLSTWRFALATFAGLLPYTLFLTGIGESLVQARSPADLLLPGLLLGLVLFAAPLAATALLGRGKSRGEELSSSLPAHCR
jgi:uncharacterized membrane protein YdjX (TVP38/TMEM64 family)